MAKNKKELDRLTQEAIAAHAAGQSYGKYKGLQYEQRQKETKPSPQIVTETTDDTRKKFDLICQCCGAHFTSDKEKQKYCSKSCQQKIHNAKYRERQRNTTNKEQRAETGTPDDLPPIGGYHDY